MSVATSMDLADVVLDVTVFPRSELSEATAEKYADAMAAGEEFPPIEVQAGTRVLLDGWHRVKARMILGLADVLAVEVTVPGGMSPKLYAASRASRHGQPLTEDDARAIAREMYAESGDTSVTAVAKALGRPRKTVEGWLADEIQSRRDVEAHERDVRRVLALMLRELGWTQQRIADHLGVDRSAVSRVCDGEPASTHDLDERTLRDAIAAGPSEATNQLIALAEQWREDRIFATWTDDERDLLKHLRAGYTVVVNMRGDAHARLWRWAEQSGLAARIDRKSNWGNPFILGEDGNRDYVCDTYEQHYLPHKPSLADIRGPLTGKALGCWCAPLRCHGDFLANVCNDNAGPTS